LRREYGRRLIVDEWPLPPRGNKRWRITIHQPNESALEAFIPLIQSGRFVVHAVHIAIDFLCRTVREAELATEFLNRGTMQKWRRRNQGCHLEVTTSYWKRDQQASPR
jgi:hypothetical protein